jgi:hypothetical protein
VRVFALLLLMGMWGPGLNPQQWPSRPVQHTADPPDGVRVAQLSSSVAGLFVKLVNEQLKGRIDPRSITYVAPAGLVLEDVVLTAPGGKPVARIGYARVELNLSALFSGEIAISKLEVDKPQLLLEMIDGELNLVTALTPRKPKKDNEPGSGTFRIDDIQLRNGGFRFTDDENVTLVFDAIGARGSLDVDMGTSTVVVDIAGVDIGSGNVRLPSLDLPMRQLHAEHVRFITDRVEVTNLSGTVLGGVDGSRPSARLDVNGRVGINNGGNLQLKGTIDAAAGAWPDRLAPLDFVTPAARGSVTVSGPFATPTIDVDASLGGASLYGYAVDSGKVVTRITTTSLTLKEGTVLRLGRGTAKVTGDITFPKSEAPTQLDLRARISELALTSALAPAELDTTLRGTVGGSLRIVGTAGNPTALAVTGDVYARNAQLYDVHLPAELDSDVRVTITPDVVGLQRLVLRDPAGSTRIGVSGDVDLKNDRLALDLEIAVGKLSPILPTMLPEKLVIGAAEAKGSVSGPFKNVIVELAAKVASGNAWGTPFQAVEARTKVTPKEVRVEGGRGMLAGGSLTQTAPLVLVLGKTTSFSSGTFRVKGAHPETILVGAEAKPLPVSGVLDVEATLRGTTKQPRVLVRAAAGRVVAANETFGDMTAAFVVTQDRLDVSSLTTRSALLKASTSSFSLTFDTMGLSGVVDVEALDLGSLVAGASAKLKGSARGSVLVGGTVDVPVVRADLVVKDLTAIGLDFGSGPLALSVQGDPAGAKNALLLGVGTTLNSAAGNWTVQAAYALDRQVVNARATISDVDLARLSPLLGTAVVPLSGTAGGTITMSGPLATPSAHLTVAVPDLVARIPAGDGWSPRSLGAASLDARLNDGALTGHVCAFPDSITVDDPDAADRPCDAPQRVWATVSGTVAPLDAAAQIQVDAVISEDKIEQLVPALARIDVGVGGRVRLAASVDVPKDGEVSFGVSARVQTLTIRPPGAPAVRLVSPVDVDYVDSRAVIGAESARFVTARDGFDLVIAAGSSVGADDIDVAVDGQLALSALKLISDDIANASGTANTHLKVSGRFDDGIRISGSVEPQPGARITPRALGQAVTFEDARITLAPAPTDATMLLVTFDSPCARAADVCPLRATVGNSGNGKVQLRGSLVARTSRSAEQHWVERYDLGASASSLELLMSTGRVELSADVALVGDAPSPVLRGRVDVSDGLFRKDFAVSNFILSAAPARPSTPLSQSLAPFGLGGLVFDVNASMQNVRTKARINAFSVDASLRGDLRISRTLSFPALDGAVEVESGTVDFPRARFEIVELQLQFPTSADGSIKPTLHLSANTELPPGTAGNSVEVPIDLSIDGGFDAMQLDLTATDSNRVWTRAELFAYILFGVVPSTDGGADLVSTSVDVASRAALRELTAPVNREVEDLVERGLGLDVNIDVVSGFQVQLGQRLVLEGPGLLLQAATSDSTSSTTASTTTTSTDAFRVRLLLFDHLPVGRALSAEGRFGVASDLRFSWRIFEE